MRQHDEESMSIEDTSASVGAPRHQARTLALQILFEVDLTAHPVDDVLSRHQADLELPPNVREYATRLVVGVTRDRASLDAARLRQRFRSSNWLPSIEISCELQSTSYATSEMSQSRPRSMKQWNWRSTSAGTSRAGSSTEYLVRSQVSAESSGTLRPIVGIPGDCA
jgi:hypothetical protein